MTPSSLQKVHWKQKKKKAELWFAEKLILTLAFGRKKAAVNFGDHNWQIRKEGFWVPQIIISEGGNVLLSQKHKGFWGAKNEVLIGQRKYEATTRQATLYNVSYTSATGAAVVSYALTATKWKAAVNVSINADNVPEQDVLLLFILGYYTMRNVIQEMKAATGIPAAEEKKSRRKPVKTEAFLSELLQYHRQGIAW